MAISTELLSKIKSKNPHTFYISIKDLVIKDRGRKDFSHLEGLIDSIRHLGIIQPPVVDQNDPEHPGKYVLLGGERRTRAMLMLGAVEIPVVLREYADKVEQAEIELDENVHRQDLSWIEKASIMKKIHDLKTKRFGESVAGHKTEGSWTLEKTANFAGVSIGTASRLISLSNRLDADPELKKEMEGRKINWTIADKIIRQRDENATLQRRVDAGEVKLVSHLRHGSCLDLIKELASDSIDLILTDMPFGITTISDLEGAGQSSSESSVQGYLKTLKMADNLDLLSATELMTKLMPELMRVLKPKAHFYFFYGADFYPMITEILKAQNVEKPTLDFDPVPLIWNKSRPTTPDRGYQYMSYYESLIYGSKLPWERRLATPSGNVLNFPPTSSKEKKHPFQKPLDLLAFLIKQSTSPGMTVLDPFAGSGATVFAAEDCKRSGVGFELDKEHFDQSQLWSFQRKT